MNLKSTKAKKILVGAVVILLLGLAVASQLVANRTASTIPPYTKFEQARELSKGEKEPCLAENQQAVEAVRNDDTYLGDDEQFSKFELAVSMGFYDVPAGTSYDVAVNSYDGEVVRGSAEYEKDYGTYNYTINKLPEAGEWEFVSMIACEK